MGAGASGLVAPSGEPHSPQNLKPRGLSVPHWGQRATSLAPHWPQNFIPAGLSNWHSGHSIAIYSAAPRVYATPLWDIDGGPISRDRYRAPPAGTSLFVPAVSTHSTASSLSWPKRKRTLRMGSPVKRSVARRVSRKGPERSAPAKA